MTEPAPDGNGRTVGARQVLGVGLAAVAVVLGAAVLTALLPSELQAVIFRTPLVIVVLVAGTAAALWLVVRGR
jgi:FtsH-binding integral membrane protein